jgi:hypothetical protein
MEKIASTKRQKRKTNRTFRFNNAVHVINIEKEGKGNPVGNTYKTKTKPNSVKSRPLANPHATRKSAVALFSAHAFSKGNTLEDMIRVVQKSKASAHLKADTIKSLQTKFHNLSAMRLPGPI